MKFGAHLPLMDFGGNQYSGSDLSAFARRAADLGFDTLAANDHMVFKVPWLDGPTALASVIGSSGTMTLATTVSLPVVRGPVPLAKTLAAIDRLSAGRLVVGVGPGSSEADYEAVGVDFSERWSRLEEAVHTLRALWHPTGEAFVGRFYSTEGITLAPTPARLEGPPIWMGSWGSEAGLRRTARLADGWLASAYNTTPAVFGEAWSGLQELLDGRGRDVTAFPNALATLWFHITDDQSEANAIFSERLVPTINRPEAVLRDRLPVGPAADFAAKLADFRDAGLHQVLIWPVTDEVRQLELFREHVWPLVTAQA